MYFLMVDVKESEESRSEIWDLFDLHIHMLPRRHQQMGLMYVSIQFLLFPIEIKFLALGNVISFKTITTLC